MDWLKRGSGILACCKMGEGAILGAPLWAMLAGGQLPAPPLISALFLPSPDISLAWPLFPSSCFPSSFLNLSSSALHLNSILQHLFSPPPFLLLFHSLCCTQNQLIYFVFLSFAPLVIVGTNGVLYFFLFSCIDPSICPTFGCC
jgi:hypothetical protein